MITLLEMLGHRALKQHHAPPWQDLAMDSNPWTCT
jgi:hypothetical protein